MTEDKRFGKSSASKLGIVVKCTGMLQLWNSIKGDGVEHEDTPDSSFGQGVHAAWAGNISELSLSERQQLVKKKADSIESKLVSEIFGGDETRVIAETRFKLSDPKTGEHVHSAQIDKAHYRDGRWLVMDLKSLYGDVEPPDRNWQLLSQVCCIADDDVVRNQRGERQTNEFICAIIQPLVSIKPELVRYSFEDIRRAKRLILQKLDEAAAPEAPRTPGIHCKYCPCATHCDVSAADLWAMEKRTNLGLTHLTPEMVAAVLPDIAPLKKRIKDFEAIAKQLASDGLLPGYEIRQQDGARYIQSQESIKAIHESLGDYIDVKDIRALVTLPFGELRTLAIDKIVARDRCDKVTAGKTFDELCQNHVSRDAPKRLLVKSQSSTKISP